MISRDSTCCTPTSDARVHVESMITVDERGQMVLPKDFRERAGITPGAKLVLVSWEKDGEVCCMSLIKSEALASMVKELIGPLMNGLAVAK